FLLRVSVIGCGYVGLVTGACLAEAGHEVVCTDIDRDRIAKLQAGGVPVYEQHLEEILTSARKAGRISYTTDAGEAIRAGESIFICVGTPPKESGEADLSAIDQDRKSTRLNSSHVSISYAVFCLKKKIKMLST